MLTSFVFVRSSSGVHQTAGERVGTGWVGGDSELRGQRTSDADRVVVPQRP